MNFINLFLGPKYPHEAEVDLFIMICEVIKEKHVCVHPTDEANKHAQMKTCQIRCSQLLETIHNRFQTDSYGSKNDFNNELPYHMLDILKNYTIKNIEHVDNLSNQQVLQD